MFRFISYLFKLDYESCRGCEILKHQLDLSLERERELREVLVSLLKPRASGVTAVNPDLVKSRVMTWSRRREALEESERRKAQILKGSPVSTERVSNASENS